MLYRYMLSNILAKMEIPKRLSFSFLCLFFTLFIPINGNTFLSVSGRNLTLNGEKVFLSGMNQAWVQYGRDFDRKIYSKSRPHLLNALDEIKKSGGNSVRIWLHTTGSYSPLFDAHGYVRALPRRFRHNLVDYVRQAQKRNIVINLSLWSCGGNTVKDFPVFGLLRDKKKLQSYIKNALTRLVRALQPYQSMGIWEIMNEPEGCVIPGILDKEDPCYDTSTLTKQDWAGWTHRNVSLHHLLRFIGMQADAIHREDPMALVTVGAWKFKSVTNQLGRRDFYSDECLRRASGGLEGARIDLYQIHSYSGDFEYLQYAPFTVDASLYALDKPLIIGEFSQRRGGMMTSEEQFLWAYRHGYNGAWSWCATQGAGKAVDDVATQMRGMRTLKGKNNQSKGGRVHIKFKKKDAFTKLFWKKTIF